MKRLILLLIMLCASAFGRQAVSSGYTKTQGFVELSGFFYSGTFYTPGLPALPAKWLDNNEATDGVNCGGYCSGVGYTAPTYEYTLGSVTWVHGPPPTCTFSMPYTRTATGKQAFINAMEACRTLTGVGIILDVPPLSTQSLGLYSSANGVTIPQTSNTHATQFLIIRSTNDAALDPMQGGLPEPVCAGGIQDNIATSTLPGLINADCAGDNLSYQSGSAIITIPTGGFTFVNGVTSNTSQYNYLQYMYQDVCTASMCTPVTLCSGQTGGPTPCAGTAFGPDLWLFEDGAASMSAGNTGNADIISVDGGVGSLSVPSKSASHIHWRRYWAHGDWTDLVAGRNAVSDGWGLGQCQGCSIVGSQGSQMLRPGNEGHVVGGNGTFYKFDNDWFEGQSSCIFSGGFSYTPYFGYIPFQDVQIGRVRCTFPQQWLGVMSVPSGNTRWSPQSLVRKNCYENKEGQRVLIYGMICENVDNSGGQYGVSVSLTVSQQSGSGHTGQNYQATLTDYTILDSIFRNTCEGIDFDGRAAPGATVGGGVSYGMTNFLLSNTLQYNLSYANTGCPGGNAAGMQLKSPGAKWIVTITENHAQTAATAVATCSVDGADCPAGPPGVGYEVMDIRTGEPISVTGCTGVPAFNVPTHV